MGRQNLGNLVSSNLALTDINDIRASQRGNLVPRDASGNPIASAGSLGEADTPFRDAHLSGDLVINGVRYGIGGLASVGGIRDVIGSSGQFARGIENNRLRVGEDGGRIELQTRDGADAEIIGGHVQPFRAFAENTNGVALLNESTARAEGIDGIRETTTTGVSPNTQSTTHPSNIRLQGNPGQLWSSLPRRLVGYRIGSEIGLGVYNFALTLGAESSISRGYRGGQLRYADNNFGTLEPHNIGANVQLLELKFVFILPDGAGGVSVVLSDQPTDDWSQQPANNSGDGNLIWHRGRDRTLLVRAEGSSSYAPYLGIYAGIAVFGSSGCVATYSVPSIGFQNLALQSAFGIDRGGRELSMRNLSGTRWSAEFVGPGDPCLACLTRGNYDPITHLEFDTANLPRTSGQWGFVYAKLSGDTSEDALLSETPPVKIDAGQRSVWLHPDSNQQAVCVGSYRSTFSPEPASTEYMGRL